MSRITVLTTDVDVAAGRPIILVVDWAAIKLIAKNTPQSTTDKLIYIMFTYIRIWILG